LEISVQFSLKPQAAQMPGYVEETLVFFLHLYVSAGSDGSLYYDQAAETFDVSVGQQNQNYVYVRSATSNAKKYMTGGFNAWKATVPQVPIYGGMGVPSPAFLEQMTPPNCGGMYLGTQVAIFTQNLGSVAGATGSVYIPTGNIGWRSNDDYEPGELGPCRVVRYDNLQGSNLTANPPVPGMVLRVDGISLAEVVPGAVTAPYVQSAGAMSRSCVNYNALSFLSFCYNQDDTPFSRVWDSYEWRDFVKGVLPQFSPEFFRSFGSGRLLAAAKAAGIHVEENEPKKSRKDSGRAISVYPSSLSPQEFQVPTMDTAARLKNLDQIMEQVQHETERASVYKPPPNY
jgi:hypothetical protein